MLQLAARHHYPGCHSPLLPQVILVMAGVCTTPCTLQKVRHYYYVVTLVASDIHLLNKCMGLSCLWANEPNPVKSNDLLYHMLGLGVLHVVLSMLSAPLLQYLFKKVLFEYSNSTLLKKVVYNRLKKVLLLK